MSRDREFHYVAVGKDRERRPPSRRARVIIRILGVVVVLALAGAAGLYVRDHNSSQHLSASERRALHTWLIAHNVDFTRLATAITGVGTATRRVDVKSTRPDPVLVGACTVLKTQATTMQALPPIPGGPLRQHLQAGLRSDLTAALRCLEAGQRGPAENPALLTQSHAALAAGGAEMQTLARLINANSPSKR